MTHLDMLNELITRHPKLAPVKQDILAAFEALRDCFARGGKVLTAGNGGSAADAEHIAGELMKRFAKKRPLSGESRTALLSADAVYGARVADLIGEALPVVSLTGHAALSTAVMNDDDATALFAQQIWGWGREGDVLLALSTSGNAENLLLGVTAALGQQHLGCLDHRGVQGGEAVEGIAAAQGFHHALHLHLGAGQQLHEAGEGTGGHFSHKRISFPEISRILYIRCG